MDVARSEPVTPLCCVHHHSSLGINPMPDSSKNRDVSCLSVLCDLALKGSRMPQESLHRLRRRDPVGNPTNQSSSPVKMRTGGDGDVKSCAKGQVHDPWRLHRRIHLVPFVN